MTAEQNKNPYHCFPFETDPEGRQFSTSAERNAPYILKVLKKVLPEQGTVLEIAAGSGQHAILFARELKKLFWLPTDPAPDKVESIRAWIKKAGSENIRQPMALDAADKSWPVEEEKIDPPVRAIVCINLIHVAPWKAGKGVFAGAGRILPEGGVLYLYGAYKINGKHTAPSNAEFDAMLRETDSSWGVRDIRDVEKEANKNGLKLRKMTDMPANNFSVIFEKQ